MSNNVIYLYTWYNSNESIQNCWSANRGKLLFFLSIFFTVIVCIFSVYLVASLFVATNDDECVKIILLFQSSIEWKKNYISLTRIYKIYIYD